MGCITRYLSCPNWGVSVTPSRHRRLTAFPDSFWPAAICLPGIRQYMLQSDIAEASQFFCLMSMSTLTLFVLWILTDDSDRSFSLDDLAFFADRFDRWSYFHRKSSFHLWNVPCGPGSRPMHNKSLQFRAHWYKEWGAHSLFYHWLYRNASW